MAQDNDKQSAPDRSRILEEIRRRAEEAEMKRLEEEDQQDEQLGVPADDGGPAMPPPTPFPVLDLPGPAETGQAGREQRVVILIERIQIALDRGRLEKAKELVAELESLAPGDSQITVFRARIEGMEQAARRAKEKKAVEEKAAAAKAAALKAAAERAAAEKAAADKVAAERAAAEAAAKAKLAQKAAEQRPPEPKPPSVRMTESGHAPKAEPPRVDPGREREERAARRKKLNAILSQANSLYQQEKYDAAQQALQGVFDLDPEHDEALQLREQIEKSRQFADRIRQEEARHKAEQTAQRDATPRPEPPPKPVEDKDVWGTKTSPQADLPFDLAPQEKGPVGPPKPPVMDRMVERLSKIHIPVKPLIIGGGALVTAFLVYLAISNLVTAVVPPKPSLLVLPSTADPLDSTLVLTADGFIEGLIRDLNHIPDLRVVNPVSAFAVRRSNATPGALARTMGTSSVLQSSMARLGDKFVFTATFVDTATGKPRWTGKQTFAALEAPGARMEIVAALLRTLDIAPPPSLQAEIRRRPTLVESAYELYQRGRAMERRPEIYPAAAAATVYEQALVADSTFPEVQAALGRVLMRVVEQEKNAPRGYVTRALFCVQKAMSGGLRSSDVFQVWGEVEFARNQFQKAEERFRAATEVAPSDGSAQRRLALVLAARGAVDDAVAAARRGATDDPYNAEAWLMLGLVQQAREVFKPEGKENLRAALRSYEQGYRVARDRSEYAAGAYSDVLVYLDRHDQAIDYLIDRIARNKEDAVAFYRLGRAQQAAGKPVVEWQNTFGRVRDLLRAAAAASPQDPVNDALLALVHTRVGAFKEAAVALARAQQIAPDDPDVLYAAARMYALQRNKEQALGYLRKALDRRYQLGAVLDMDFYNLWPDEQFVEVVRR